MDALEVGDIIENRYRVDYPIARGGMSTVYRCIDLRLGRAVAAKIMHDELLDDPVFIRRFEREARAMAQLSHPNLIGVYDFSADGDPVFLIMELITGGTLRELLAERGPMPPHAAAAVLREVLTGLTVVHRRGMVHRDIKPDNVLIGGDGAIKVGDFGLVRSAAAHTVNADQIVGTVSYLSPEQVTGEKITPASDVYSLGVVLFELLTGTVPFSGSTPLAHATARLSADVPAPSDRIEGVPPLFDALVASATTRDVEARFTDAGEFVDALDDVARELELPRFRVPVPENSAAARTAAHPTTMGPNDATDIFEPTRVEPPAPETVRHGTSTAVTPGDPSATPAGEPEPEDDRPRLSFASRVDESSSHQPTRVDAPETVQAAGSESARPEAARPETALIPGAAPLAHPPAPPAPAPRASQSAAMAAGAQATGPQPVGTRPEPREKPLTNRGIGKLIVWLLFSAMATAMVALGGWWFGSGLYEQVPALLH